MTKLLQKLPQPVKNLVGGLAQLTIGRLPPSPLRLTGKLARDGGIPVRDTRLRPWASERDGGFFSWYGAAGGCLRRVFLSGIEGLPQPLAQEFAQQWAMFCGC